MNTIQDLYDSGQINDEEMDRLASIREGFIEALEKDASAVVNFIQEVFSECNDDEIEKISEMVEALRTDIFMRCEDPDQYVLANIASDIAMEKTANIFGSALSYIGEAGKKLHRNPIVGNALSAALAGTVGLHLLNTISQGVRTIKHPFEELADRKNTAIQSEAALSSILKSNPELKADKSTYDNFALLRKYAPQTVATNKPLAETMLKKMQQWGGVDPQSLAQMIKMEKDYLDNAKSRSLIPESQPPSLSIKAPAIMEPQA